MSILESRYIAAIDGPILFDDIGCMLFALEDHKESPAHIWVCDYQKNIWLDARTAAYVYAPMLGTPMNSGYVALSDSIAAVNLASYVHGVAYASWDELVLSFRLRTIEFIANRLRVYF